MPHAFNENEDPFGQCGHFNQVEPFEKPWFLVVIKKSWKIHCTTKLMAKYCPLILLLSTLVNFYIIVASGVKIKNFVEKFIINYCST
jgi:hypothetical protein